MKVAAGVEGVPHGRFTGRMRFKVVTVVIVLAIVSGAGAAVLMAYGGSDGEPGAAAIARYLAAWTRGDDRAAAALTDAPGRAARALRQNRAGLDGASVRARVTERDSSEDAEHARVRVRWDVPRFGPLEYEVALAAVPAEDGLARPLERAGRASAARPRDPARHERQVAGPRADPRPRRDVRWSPTGPSWTSPSTPTACATRARRPRRSPRSWTPTPARSRAGIRNGGRGRYIPVITLRHAAFRARERQLEAIPGVTTNATTASLAPTPGSAAPCSAPSVPRRPSRSSGRAAGWRTATARASPGSSRRSRSGWRVRPRAAS